MTHRPPKVFISHTTADDAVVSELAKKLVADGIEVLNDGWEVAGGTDFVAWINRRLDECDAGILVFSANTVGKPWVESEVSALIYMRVSEHKRLIPVLVPDGGGSLPKLPPLLRPLARFEIGQVQAIADQLLAPIGAPGLSSTRPDISLNRLTVTLQRRAPTARATEGSIGIDVALDGRPLASAELARLPPAIETGLHDFLQGFRHVTLRSPAVAERELREASLDRLGEALGETCFPGDAMDALADLLRLEVGRRLEVLFESADPELLGLPFEAVRLHDGTLLATHPTVEMLRRPSQLPSADLAPLAGPLKILVAVGAPDETRGGGPPVLDPEHEVGLILDAVEEARRLKNVEVRVLEVGSAEAIGEAFERDEYHVLYLTCHGSMPGPGLPPTLLLEDELGAEVPTTPGQLIEPIARHGRRLPLVILNACHSGVAAGQAASFATALLSGGAEAVIAMQASVSDQYGTALAREFFGALAAMGVPRPAAALARARKKLEQARRVAKARAASAPVGDMSPAQASESAGTLPEYATATLHVRGADQVLVDFSRDREPLAAHSVLEMEGPVLQLGLDDLIGRRRELRETLRGLREPAEGRVGVSLTGVGGIGKSALAGRAMRRMAEDGFAVAALVGRWSLQGMAEALANGLIEHAIRQGDHPRTEKAAMALADSKLPDEFRWPLILRTLATRDVVVVLDDFEQNLSPGGERFLDPALETALATLAASTRRGRLLFTCRYPIPGRDLGVHRVPLGPLSEAEVRKLLLRLPALRERPSRELLDVVRTVGGHPRVLELLDALLAGGEGRLEHVTARLHRLLGESGATSGSPTALPEAVQQAVTLGARDVLLDELLALAQARGLHEVLLHAAVSNLPISPAGVAHALADGPAGPDAVEAVKRAIEQLEGLSLLVWIGEDAWVQRWIAEGLLRVGEQPEREERCARVGRYRLWRVKRETHDTTDGHEAMRNFIAARRWDDVAAVAGGLIEALGRFRQTMAAAAVAHEALDSLPEEHINFAPLANREADAHLALGRSDLAMERWIQVARRLERLAKAEPDRADFQRDLAVSYERMAAVAPDAAESWLKRALEIRRRALELEPEGAIVQRELAICLLQCGQALKSAEQFAEGAARLIDLKRRGVLEARYVGLATRLEIEVPDGTPEPGKGA